MAVLDYLAKLKRGLGLAFEAHFLHDFSIIMFLIQISINGQSLNVTPYFFFKISNKMCYRVLIYAVDDVVNVTIFLGSTSKAISDGEKKRGRQKYRNLNILRTKRVFLMK